MVDYIAQGFYFSVNFTEVARKGAGLVIERIISAADVAVVPTVGPSLIRLVINICGIASVLIAMTDIPHILELRRLGRCLDDNRLVRGAFRCVVVNELVRLE